MIVPKVTELAGDGAWILSQGLWLRTTLFFKVWYQDYHQYNQNFCHGAPRSASLPSSPGGIQAPDQGSLLYINLHGSTWESHFPSFFHRELTSNLHVSSKTPKFHSEPCTKEALRKYQKIILQQVRITSQKRQGTMQEQGWGECRPFFPPEGVCLHVIDFYLTLDGLIHRFNYIMCCPINTALQLFYIQSGCQIKLNGFFKAYKAGKYLSLVGIFCILVTKSLYAKAGSKTHLLVRKPI